MSILWLWVLRWKVKVRHQITLRLLEVQQAVFRVENENARETVDGIGVLSGSQKVVGLLLQLSGKITEKWSVMTGYTYMDGKVTAGHQSAKAKNNSQLSERSEVAKILGEIFLIALEKNQTFISAALPLKVYPPLFNSYSGGQSFGTHKVKLHAPAI